MDHGKIDQKDDLINQFISVENEKLRLAKQSSEPHKNFIDLDDETNEDEQE